MTLLPQSPIVLVDDFDVARWYVVAVQELIFAYHCNSIVAGEEKAQAIYDAELAKLQSQLTS